MEIDPDTGTTEIVDYTIVDDFGVTVNPVLLVGQVHGGVVQGIGQALTEGAVYDEDGQLVTASFMDYAMPRADTVPSFHFETRNVPSTTNALGIKGAGEAGTIGCHAGDDECRGRRALPRLRKRPTSRCRRRRSASGRQSTRAEGRHRGRAIIFGGRPLTKIDGTPRENGSM